MQLAGRVIAAHQAVQSGQVTFVLTFEGGAQYLFGFALGAHLAQLLGIGQHQLRFLTLGCGQLLPGALQRLASAVCIVAAGGRQAQVLAPCALFQRSKFSGRQHLGLAQVRQQANQRRPVATLKIQPLQQAQHLVVVRVPLLHGQQCFQGAIRFASVHLQLCVGQGNCQFGLGLALQSALKKVVAVFLAPQLVGRTGRAEVIQQRLALGLGGAVQMALGTGPTSLGKVQLPLLDGNANASAAITPRPGVDHATGGQHQAYQVTQQPEGQNHPRQGRERCPQPGLVTEAAIGNQHVTAVLGHRDAQRCGNHNGQYRQQVDTLHGLPPSRSAGRWRRWM